ncbi:hypothetical protein HWV62_31871 [Athelia sp. TMB]|nr:hypothetical protein HWV62_31871 [Athelia sp. TMB]
MISACQRGHLLVHAHPSLTATRIVLRAIYTQVQGVRTTVNIQQAQAVTLVDDIWSKGDVSKPLSSAQMPIFNTAGISNEAQVYNIGRDHIINNYMDDQVGINTYEKVASIDDHLKILYDRDLDDTIHAWLAAPDVSQNFNAARRKHQLGTGSWLIDAVEFNEWKTKPAAVMGIYGNPLSRYENFLRSLLSQLANRCGGLPAILKDFYNMHGYGREQPSLKSLNQSIRHVTEGFDHVYLMIDSLDECGDRAELLAWIRSTATWNIHGLHVLFTSRPETDIVQGLVSVVGLCRVQIDASTSQKDIEVFLDAQLANRNMWNEKTRQLVKVTLADRADGMFRWVALQIDDLQRCFSIRDVKQQLERLPQNLEETYERILARSERRSEVLQILQWLAFSIRALSIEEIADVVSIDLHAENGPSYDPDLKYGNPMVLLTICSGLVALADAPADGYTWKSDPSVRTIVKLAHFSVKEYLLSAQIGAGNGAFFGINERLSHSIITQTCLAYLLNFDKLDSINEENYRSFPLAPYAAEFWIVHHRLIGHSTPPAVQDLVLKLLDSGQSHALLNSIRLYNSERPWDPRNLQITTENIPHPLNYASTLGLPSVVEYHLNNGIHPDGIGGNLGTPLNAASYAGHIEVARLLLNRGADVNLVANIRFFTIFGHHVHDPVAALQLAARQGHIDMVRLLLDFGAQCTDSAPLFDAIRLGYIEIVQLLLQRGADPSAVDIQHGEDALELASSKGQTTIVKLLLEHGASVNTQNDTDHPALAIASYQCHIDIVALLLEHGADVHARTDLGYTALELACSNGAIDIARMLLEHGADANTPDSQKDTPLSCASRRGHIQIVKLLLEHGADVNSQNVQGLSALIEASSRCHTEIVALLLEHGADVKARTNRGYTALESVCSGGAIDIARMLLDHGADINNRDSHNNTPLSWASWGGQLEIVKLLLERGAYIAARDDDGDTPLLCATLGGYSKTVKVLLEQGADVGARNHTGETALSIASSKGNFDIVESLLAHGAVRE